MMDDMDLATSDVSSGTRPDATAATVPVHEAPQVSTTEGPSLTELVSSVGVLRTRTRLIGSDVAETDADVARLLRDVRDERLAEATRKTAKQSASSLLDQLNDRGFSWRDIARMSHVSV